MEQVTIFIAREAGTSFLYAGQVTMPHDKRMRKERVEFPQEFPQSLLLFRGTGIGGFAAFIQSAFITNTYAATIESTDMGTYFQQSAMLCHDSTPGGYRNDSRWYGIPVPYGHGEAVPPYSHGHFG